MKRGLWILISLLLLMTLTAPAAYASETQETTEETLEETTSSYTTDTSGTCGDNVTWRLEDHTLILSGSGAVDAGSPWGFYKDTIHTLILDGAITAIGDQAFYACNNLRYIDFGDSLVEIGNQAFYSCNALEAIRLPVTFRKFGPECFRDCSGLQVVYCEGPMPSFKASCLYNDQTVSVYYPATAPWPQEEVQRLMSNFGSRLSVNAGTPDVLEDYLEDADFTVPETLPPETTVPETTVPETTEATIPETTVPATVPTAAATEHTDPEMPEEEPVFQLESEPLFVTEPEQEPSPAEVSPQTSGNLSYGLWILIAAAAITGLLILALLIRIIARGGHGRYED